MWKRFFSFLTLPFTNNKNENISYGAYQRDNLTIEPPNNYTSLQIDPNSGMNCNDNVINIVGCHNSRDQCGICYNLFDKTKEEIIQINTHYFHKECIRNQVKLSCCRDCGNLITISPKSKF